MRVPETHTERERERTCFVPTTQALVIGKHDRNVETIKSGIFFKQERITLIWYETALNKYDNEQSVSSCNDASKPATRVHLISIMHH